MLASSFKHKNYYLPFFFTSMRLGIERYFLSGEGSDFDILSNIPTVVDFKTVEVRKGEEEEEEGKEEGEEKGKEEEENDGEDEI